MKVDFAKRLQDSQNAVKNLELGKKDAPQMTDLELGKDTNSAHF